MSGDRDGWSKAEVIFSALGALVMPVALLVIGGWITTQQEAAAEATRQAERLTSFLGPLASDNPRERRLAIEVAGFLAQKGQLPLELVPALVSIVQNDADSQTAQAASQALAQVEATNPQLRPQIQTDLNALQARVYFHITNESQRAAAQRAASQLATGQDLTVPGIERAQGPNQSELRFFKKADRAEADRLAEMLKRLGVAAVVRDLSGRYDTSDKIRPRHFELWLGPDFSKG
jgi:hypothetical protein